VAPNQIGLKLNDLVSGNPHVSQLAEAGIDAVNRLAGLDRVVNQPPGVLQLTPGGGIYGDAAGGIAGDLDYALDA
jgi:hypothetical protein